MSLIAKDDWPKDGPGVHASQTQLRALAKDIVACSDEDELDACLYGHKDLLRLAFVHNEQWWFAMQQMIETQRKTLREENQYEFNSQR